MFKLLFLSAVFELNYHMMSQFCIKTKMVKIRKAEISKAKTSTDHVSMVNMKLALIKPHL